MHGTKSRGCREHWRISENAQDEILCNNPLGPRYVLKKRCIYILCTRDDDSDGD